MEIEEIQELVAFAEGYKKSLEERGCTKVTVDVIPDDRRIEGYFIHVVPIKYITVNVKLKKGL